MDAWIASGPVTPVVYLVCAAGTTVGWQLAELSWQSWTALCAALGTARTSGTRQGSATGCRWAGLGPHSGGCVWGHLLTVFEQSGAHAKGSRTAPSKVVCRVALWLAVCCAPW